MGSGASTLPESLNAEEAAELFGAAFDSDKFAALADAETGAVSREKLLEAAAQMEQDGMDLAHIFDDGSGGADEAPERPATPPDMRTVEEISDDEFEEELKTIASERFQSKTYKIRV